MTIWPLPLAMQSDHGIVLAQAALEELRRRKVPSWVAHRHRDLQPATQTWIWSICGWWHICSGF